MSPLKSTGRLLSFHKQPRVLSRLIQCTLNVHPLTTENKVDELNINSQSCQYGYDSLFPPHSPYSLLIRNKLDSSGLSLDEDTPDSYYVVAIHQFIFPA